MPLNNHPHINTCVNSAENKTNTPKKRSSSAELHQSAVTVQDHNTNTRLSLFIASALQIHHWQIDRHCGNIAVTLIKHRTDDQ